METRKRDRIEALIWAVFAVLAATSVMSINANLALASRVLLEYRHEQNSR